MSNDIVRYTAPPLPAISVEDVERALTIGDLAKMPPEVRIRYYCATCASAGLNPMTQPFTPMKNQAGQVVLYANKEAAEQLRKRDRVSIRILSREKDDGLYIVTVQASTPDGRCEESQGIVEITNLKGTALANAMMKAETKAKRRVTLALCGLGFPTEDENYGAQPVAFDMRTGEIPADDLEVSRPLIHEQQKSLEAHIADLYGDREPVPPTPDALPLQVIAQARRAAVGEEIDETMRQLGWNVEDADAYWQKVQATYSDLTPGALARVRDHLQSKLAQAVTPEPPVEEDDTPTLWEEEER